LERDKIQEEYEQRLAEIAYYTSLLADESKLFGVIKDEILEIKEKYGDERRTKLLADEGEIDIDDLINEQEIAVTLTNFGYIKRTAADTYKAQRRGGKGIMGLTTKEEDYVKHLLLTSSHNVLLFVTNAGKIYSLKGYELPDAARTAKGTPIVNLLPLEREERVAAIIPIKGFEDSQYLLMGTKNGTIKKTALYEYKNIRKSGLIAIELREGDEIVNACLTNDDEDIVIVTHDGMAIRFENEDARAVGRGSIGVRGISLSEGDYVVGVDVCKPGDSMLLITEKGFGKRTSIDEYRTQSRGGKGLITYKISEKTGNVAGMMFVTDDNDVMLITQSGTIIRLHAADINTIGRATRGVTLMRTSEENPIVGCSKTFREEEVDEEAEGEDGAIETPEAEQAEDTENVAAVEPVEEVEKADGEA
jgi:DNA gyrase subunit A